MSVDTVPESALSTTGTVLVGGLLCAQLPAMYLVVRGQTPIAKLSLLPTLGQAGNFLCWVVYGLVAAEPAVLRVNVIGCGFAALYLSIFLLYSAGCAARLRVLAGAAATFAVLGGAWAAAILIPADQATRINALGITAVILNTAMYASPLGAMRAALLARDASGIPLLLTLAGLGCSLCWGAYGWLKGNYFIFGPNAAGLLLSLLQLAIAGYIVVRGGAAPGGGKGGGAAGEYLALDAADEDEAAVAPGALSVQG